MHNTGPIKNHVWVFLLIAMLVSISLLESSASSGLGMLPFRQHSKFLDEDVPFISSDVLAKSQKSRLKGQRNEAMTPLVDTIQTSNPEHGQEVGPSQPQLPVEVDDGSPEFKYEWEIPGEERTYNAIRESLQPVQHHPIFSEPFHPWKGKWDLNSGVFTDFMGARFNFKDYCNPQYMDQPRAHALRVLQCKLYERAGKSVTDEKKRSAIRVRHSWPVISEEYFEYSDILTSVKEHVDFYPEKPYIFIELGGGYAHWTVTAHRALRQLSAKAEFKGKVVELDPGKEPMLQRSVALNNLEGKVEIVMKGLDAKADHLLVKSRGGLFMPIVGAADGKRVEVDTVEVFLAEFDHIAMVDMDIQGAEFKVFTDSAMEAMNAKVIRVHIGTHEGSGGEKKFMSLHNTFLANNWTLEHKFCKAAKTDTLWGPIEFGDGALSFVNPRFQHLRSATMMQMGAINGSFLTVVAK